MQIAQYVFFLVSSMAKQIVLRDEQISQVEALASVLSLEQVADYFGISKPTFYKIMERQPEVAERFKKGKAKAIVTIGKNLIEQAKDGNLTAIIFYLKTQAGWRETEQQDIEQQTKQRPTQININVKSGRKNAKSE